MKISDDLQCLFHAEIEERDGSYVVELPESELSAGGLQEGQLQRVALLAPIVDDSDSAAGGSESEAPEPARRTNGHTPQDSSAATVSRGQQRRANTDAPPVQEGDQRTVDIEDIGEQGDGIARVDRGYIVIVPDTEQGERVTIEITDVAETVGFAEVVSREAYYE